MKRVLGTGLGIAAIAVVVLVVTKCRGSSSSDTDLSGSGSEPNGAKRRTVDPRTLAHGSITGTIRDDFGVPIANARVCAGFASPALAVRLTREPVCVFADAMGRYRIESLLAARYCVDASSFPERVSMWITQKASTSSWLIIATTPTCGAKK